MQLCLQTETASYIIKSIERRDSCGKKQYEHMLSDVAP